MTNMKQWQRQLLSKIAQHMQHLGFEGEPKEQSLIKMTSFGKVVLHLSFIEHQNHFDVTADVAIRFDDLEELINRQNRFLTKSEKGATYTLGCELGNYSEGCQKRWTIRSTEDVPMVCEAILSAFNEIGLPYITKFSEPLVALEILSGDDSNSWLHSPLHGTRATKAVGLSLLTQGKEAAQKLAMSKISFLEARKDFGLASFRDFLKKIDVL